MLDDSVDIEIFNPISFGYENNIVSGMTFEYLDLEQSKRFLSEYSKISFKDKIDVISELLIRNDVDNCYEIVSSIKTYKRMKWKDKKIVFPYKLIK